jgi:SET domain-containing protein
MKGVRTGKSSVSGRGLFATETFERGDRICEYSGRLYRGDTHPDNRYLFEISDLWTLDGSPKSNVGRWANHSCKPNAATEVTQRKRVWLYAIKRIRPGDEILYDYGDEYTKHRLKDCKCPVCRTRVQDGNNSFANRRAGDRVRSK